MARRKREEIAVESMTPAAREKLLAESQYGGKTRRRGRSPAKPVIIDGVRFASRGEGQRWLELRGDQDAGAISDLSPHPRFVLDEGFVDGRDGTIYQPLTYTADYMYRKPAFRGGPWIWVVEDFKGWRGLSRDYGLRVRWFRRKYPQYLFIETRNRDRRKRRKKPSGDKRRAA